MDHILFFCVSEGDAGRRETARAGRLRARGSSSLRHSMLRFLLDTGAPEAYVLDKDGTLVTQGTGVDGAADFVGRLNVTRTPFVVLSNTGERTGAQAADDLSRTLGAPVPPRCVVTALEHMTDSLRDEGLFDRVLVVGKGAAHVRAVVRGAEPLLEATPAPEAAAARAGGRVCVAVASDGEVEAYCDAVAAAAAWVERGAALYVTSADASLAATGGARRPGPGVFLRAVETTLGRGAVASLRVFGKGGGCEAALGDEVMRRLEEQGFAGERRRVLMVGDRFDTDIRAGGALGWRTCLVESGCHRVDVHARDFPADVADAVADSVRDLLRDQTAPAATHADAVRDLVYQALHRLAPTGGAAAAWIAERVQGAARRVDATLAASGLAARPRRIRSHPDLAGLEARAA